jgi:predicted RecB family nuclease
MRGHNGSLTFTPSDLTAFLACPHLTTLEVGVARGELQRPFRVNRHAALIRAKGQEHETMYLRRLQDEGRPVVEIERTDAPWDFERMARETEEAMRDGADVIYQATFLDRDWRGLADFVERQPDGGYEAVDTKLARRAKPAHALQLCFYTEQIARIQGRLPSGMHVINGLGLRESFSPPDYLAYYRRLRRRFVGAVRTGTPTYPYPVEHCGLCDFLALCQEQWEHDDHLTLVAGISRLQVERLVNAGIVTLEALGDAAPDARIPKMRKPTFENLRLQAELQLHQRRTGEHRIDLLPPEEERGFALLPRPSRGDIWLDLEGHPWFEPGRGLDYLFGWIELDEDGPPRYECLWARDRTEEKLAFERLMEAIVDRRRRFPDMHVYHYASYERTALQRMMGEHGTRESELDDLLRGDVLVDLYRVTRQALRASVPGYSIKDVEELYNFERSAEISGGSESVVAFEAWTELGDDSLLDEIQAYNAEDCLSLYELHRWLLSLRPTDQEWRRPPDAGDGSSEEAEERFAEIERVRAELLDGANEGDSRWLLAQLLGYHRREHRPQWWEYFHHRELDEEELLEDADTIGGLQPTGTPVQVKQSLEYLFTFPPQEHKIGTRAVDPQTERQYAVAVDDEHGIVTLRRGVAAAGDPLPTALIPQAPLSTKVQREAVLRFAQNQPAYRALAEILERRPPRAKLDGTLSEAALSLERSYLFVQGPPGSGKTWNGARMAVALMRAGRRVGITALSHKAIDKFLEDVEKAAEEERFSFRGMKKCSGDESRYNGIGFVENTKSNEAMLNPELQLLAGTSFLFAREELNGHVNTLFIDEGGQFALADAIAVGTAAENVVLLGDPNQLPQVSQGAHPPGANASVLSHLLGDDATVRPEMGIFLEQTWRLRPELNRFISSTFYDNRLEPAPICTRRAVEDGAGLRCIFVEHAAHRQAAPEEAAVIAAEIDRLLGTPYSDGDTTRALLPEDFVVVAPYNAHVRCLRQHIPEQRIRIGTVDKFQGQEAAIVFYSMASSTSEDVPRGLDFLFSRNRFNVAVSRAQCLSYLVCSERLLDTNCRTVEQIPLANALCSFAELAQKDGLAPSRSV